MGVVFVLLVLTQLRRCSMKYRGVVVLLGFLVIALYYCYVLCREECSLPDVVQPELRMWKPSIACGVFRQED